MKTVLIGVVAMGGLVACSPEEKRLTPDGGTARRSDEEVTAIAKAAAQEAFQKLSTRLSEAIAEGGPAHAIPICSREAMSLTAAAAEAHGVEMKRLSDRPRRAGQVVTDEDLAAIEAMREEPVPRVEWDAQALATVRLPIVLSQPLCLKCHGGPEDIDAATRSTLRELYPEDQAVGYSLGDLRGIWRIEVPPQG